MKKIFTLLTLVLSLAATAQSPFPMLDTNYVTREVIVSKTLKMDMLFEANRDYVWNGKEYAVAKTWHDFTGFIPLGTGNDSCILIVNHELRNNAKNPKLGDGGGMTVFRANRNAITKRWQVVPYKGHKFWSVDFSHLRGTLANCGGATLPNNSDANAGRFMTGEEWTFTSNTDALLLSSFSDTSNFTIPSGPFKGKVIPFYQNIGYMVTVDARNAKALYKSYAMGRNSFEGGFAMPDGKTVYLGVDATPAPFFKFVADTAYNYEYGQLYAFKEGANGSKGEWLEIPRVWDSIYDPNAVAFRKGATMYTRLEWVVGKGNKIYISETGNDAANYKSGYLLGGKPSAHFAILDTLGGQKRDSIAQDYYGRVLSFDTDSLTMKPFIEGGRTNKAWNFSNPDGLSIHSFKGKDYLVIVEDLNGTSQGRSTSAFPICEAFFLDLSKTNPTREDLMPFVASPAGAELTGSVSTPDGTTIFINSQHPSADNIAPFNNDVTVALTGFSFTSPTNEIEEKDKLIAYPNPTSDVLFFNKTVDVSLYNISGQQIRIERNANQINLSGLNAGIYFLQTITGEVIKVVKQ